MYDIRCNSQAWKTKRKKRNWHEQAIEFFMFIYSWFSNNHIKNLLDWKIGFKLNQPITQTTISTRLNKPLWPKGMSFPHQTAVDPATILFCFFFFFHLLSLFVKCQYILVRSVSFYGKTLDKTNKKLKSYTKTNALKLGLFLPK